MNHKKEYQDVKYIRELHEFWNAYMYAIINEIYVGIAVNLGLSEKEAYDLAKKRPDDMKKAKFFKSIFDKFKNIFKYKIPKFRIKKDIYNKGKPLTPQQWDAIDKSIEEYWSKNANPVYEDVTTKSFMLGRDTTQFRKKRKPYKNKSLYQVEYDQYDGDMPDNIKEAYSKYDFTNSEKNALNQSFSDVAMYVRETNSEIKEAIRQQVQSGLENNKSATKIASDLYWEVEKDKNLVNKYTAEAMRRNWHRIASTEMASVYEAGILAPYESDAVESLKDPKKAQYFVFTGGTCPWCRDHQGVLTRLVPKSVVTDTKNDSLKDMGIKDPNTDIAIWVGKNNVGFKETKAVHEWRICTPAHPYNVATMQPIDIETEYYNEKSGNVERRPVKRKYVPPPMDYDFKTYQEEEYRKPTVIGRNLVRYNNNMYEAVDADVADQKLEERRKDRSKPIPVSKNSPDYRRIFLEAEKNV
jgi:predicted transcriptional regulator